MPPKWFQSSNLLPSLAECEPEVCLLAFSGSQSYGTR